MVRKNCNGHEDNYFCIFSVLTVSTVYFKLASASLKYTVHTVNKNVTDLDKSIANHNENLKTNYLKK